MLEGQAISIRQAGTDNTRTRSVEQRNPSIHSIKGSEVP